jgi:hypothetical protein
MNDIATRPDLEPARIEPATVRGWAVDADPENDPTYPYRERDKDDHSGQWRRPPQQQVDVEVLQSIEHKQRPAVVGTSTPPSGISGAMRRLAYRRSESNLLHWLLLMGADRVNMVEGVVQDLARARVPNIAAETGMRADWQHDKPRFVVKSALGLGAVALLATALSRRRGR